MRLRFSALCAQTSVPIYDTKSPRSAEVYDVILCQCM